MLSKPRPKSSRSSVVRRRLARTSVLLLTLLLAGCQRDPEIPADNHTEPDDTQPLASTPADAAEPILPMLLPGKPVLPKPMLDGVYLSTRLPQETVAYARVPNPWHLLGDVVGRASDSAYGSPPWRAQLDAMRAQAQQAARRDGWPTGLGSTLALVDSPIEILLLDPQGQLEGDTAMLLSTSLNSSRAADAARLVAEWAAWWTGEPPAAIPIDARGYGEAAIGYDEPLRLQFLASEQRLYVYWGQAADLASFSDLLARISRPISHRAQAQIEAADESGRGLLLWLDLQALRTQAQDSRAIWRGLPDIAGSALFAVGTVRRHGQMTVALDEVRPEILGRLPKTASSLPVTTAGSPRWALMAALPSRAEWEALREWLKDPASENSAAAVPEDQTDAPTQAPARPTLPNPLDELDAWLRPLIGVNAATAFDRIGPELVLWRDAAGSFAALRLRDEEGFDSMLARLNSSLEGRRDARRWNGLDVHEFSLPALALERHRERQAEASAALLAADQGNPDASQASASGAAAEPGETTASAASEQSAALEAGLRRSLQRVRTRAYWIEENGFLVFTGVPQSLVDRQSSPAKSNLQGWYEDIQSTPSAGSLLLYSAGVEALPRDSYHRMIQLLQAVGDLLQVPVDPYAFPNADEVALPQRGAVAMRLGVDGRRLSLSLRYEDMPLEALAEPMGLATAVVAGALGSIAVAAHADHRARIVLLDAIAQTLPHRQALDTFEARRRRPARQWAELGTSAPDLPDPAMGLSLSLADAALELQFADEPTVPQPLRGKRLLLRRDRSAEPPGWACAVDSSDIEPKLLQAACASLTTAAVDA
jgi:hypothetical protein